MVDGDGSPCVLIVLTRGYLNPYNIRQVRCRPPGRPQTGYQANWGERMRTQQAGDWANQPRRLLGASRREIPRVGCMTCSSLIVVPSAR